MARRRPGDDVELVEVDQKLADVLRRRYAPVVKQCLAVAEHTYDLNSLMLSVYLQGVRDGAAVAEKLEEA